jgi:membrane protein YdbS with pleckstrin-like domain
VFTNHQIDIASLPKLEEVKLEGISTRYYFILLFNTITIYLVFIGIFIFLKLKVVADSFIHTVFWYIILGLLLASIFQCVIYKLGLKKRRYALREKDIIYSHGYFFNDTTTLPLNRIQHIEISISFIAKKLGLATLKVYSAGESGGDIIIKGLPKAIADSQYAYLTQLLNERV